MSKTVFVTGATGLVGSRLVTALRERGDNVLALSRRSGPDTIEGDPSVPGPWLDLLDSCDAVVHLAGENIFAERWSTSFMKRIRDSRVASTELISGRLAKSGNKSVAFISCSAIGYYGDPKTDFMASVCHEWEAAADRVRFAGNRVVHPRLGIVLDPKGGAMTNLVRPYRFFVGGRIGSGKQMVSWIHHEDLTRLLMFAIDSPKLLGPVNATAPHPVSNDELGRAIGKVLGRPHWLPVPRWALRIALGKIADTLVGGTCALPKAALEAGFEFRYPRIVEALQELLGKSISSNRNA